MRTITGVLHYFLRSNSNNHSLNSLIDILSLTIILQSFSALLMMCPPLLTMNQFGSLMKNITVKEELQALNEIEMVVGKHRGWVS